MRRRALFVVLVVAASLLGNGPYGEVTRAGSDTDHVWKLVEVVDYPGDEVWKASATDYWKFDHSYGRGTFSARTWHKDDQTYIAYGAEATWSSPPSVFKAGDRISLEATLSETENTHKWNTSAAAVWADLAPPDRGVGQRGEIAFATADGLTDISINGAVNSSAHATFTAVAPAGNEGARMAVRVVFYMGATMATYYVYEWQPPDGEAAPVPTGPPTRPASSPPSDIVVEFTDRGDVAIAGFSGQVEISLSGDLDELDLLPLHLKRGKIEIKDGMVIRTGPRSGLILAWSDLTTFVVGPETTLIFRKVTRRQETALELAAGTIWGNIKRMMTDGTMEVTMNQAVAGIKGTTFVCEEDGTTSSLKVLTGSVEFADRLGSVITVQAGEQATATVAGLVGTQGFDVSEEQAGWDEFTAGMRSRGPARLTVALVIGAVGLLLIIVLLLFRRRPRARAQQL